MMVLFTLCYSQPVLARAWLYSCFAERLRSCAVCGRHTWTSARKRQLLVRLFFLLLLWRYICHAVRVKRCATRPSHGIPGAVYLHACRARGHVLRCRGTCAVMRGLVVPPIHVHHLPHHNMPLRPELSRHSANIFRPPRYVQMPIAETGTSSGISMS